MKPAEWWAKLDRSREGRAALRAFERIRADDVDRAITLERIARACYLAATYAPNDDPAVKRRAALRAARSRELAQLSRAARTLAKAWERNAPGLVWAAGEAQIQSGHDQKWIDERYFSALANALEGKLPEVHGGPWLHRFTVGNLRFEKAIGRGVAIGVETMLGFEIVFYLRMLTAGQAKDSTQRGQRMPAGGRPHHDVAAAFVRAALRDSRVETRTLADRLRKLPADIGLMAWPHESAAFARVE